MIESAEATEIALPSGPGRFKPYPRYRNADVEWLGHVPIHWQVSRIKDHARVVSGFPFDSQYFNRGEGTPLVRIRDLDSDSTEVNYVGPVTEDVWITSGDVIVGMDGDFNVARWKGLRALLNQRMCCLRSKATMDTRFMAYVLPLPLRVINDLTYSTTVKHLSSLDVGRIRFALCPLSEQTKIADLLDRETAKIDTLVVKKERLIELLQEKRTALITRAVTKGFDPTTVPMKHSRVEWLGEIPAHWEVIRLGRLARIGNGSTPRRDNPEFWLHGSFPWLASGKINEEVIVEADEFVSELALRECHLPVVPPESLLVAITGEGQTRGRTALLKFKATISQHLAYVTPVVGRLDAAFLWRSLQARYAWLRMESSGDGSTRAALTCEYIKSVSMAVPPCAEQKEIVSDIEAEAARITLLITRIGDGIERLKEYRTALISAAVTGKIDVRDELSKG